MNQLHRNRVEAREGVNARMPAEVLAEWLASASLFIVLVGEPFVETRPTEAGARAAIFS